MFVLIAGGGRTGTQLASFLHDQNYKVRLIEYRPNMLSRLHRELPTQVIFEGDPTDPQVLSAAGIEKADVVTAVTADDSVNLSICYMARAIFGVRRTIGRINNPRNAWLFNETFHVDVALNQASIIASMVEEEMSLGDMMTLHKIRRGNYSLVEEKLAHSAPVIGKAIKDLVLPESSVIAAIIRDGKVVVPRGVTVFEEEDEVLAITDRDGARQLAEMFSPSVRQTREEPE